jgi:hypothetical protein
MRWKVIDDNGNEIKTRHIASGSERSMHQLQKILGYQGMEVKTGYKARLVMEIQAWNDLPEEAQEHILDFAQGFMSGYYNGYENGWDDAKNGERYDDY